MSLDQNSSQRILLMLCKILNKYQWLMNSYNVDYFLENNWDKLPHTWKSCLHAFKLEEIPQLLNLPHNNNATTRHVFPLTLLSLRVLCNIVRTFRNATPVDQLPFHQVNKNDKIFTNFSELNLSFSNEFQLPVKPLKKSDHILCRKIKLKKRHEIERLCKVIPSLMKMANNCTDIVDCGSGHGHLDRILALCYGFRIFSIESNGESLTSATTHDSNVLNALRKYQLTQMSAENMPTKVNCHLTTQDNIDSLVGEKATLGPHMLLGLHACGPLSNLILDQFVSNSNSSCLLLACCCYMKNGVERFPMSNFMQKHITFTLSAEAKELACHAIEKFLNKFDDKEMTSLKVHGYRACLELLIDKYDPEKRHTAMRSVKIDASMTFKEYAIKAIRDLNIAIPLAAFESELVQRCLDQIDRVVIYYSLRMMLAPVIELFILLDYQQYLAEHCQVKRSYLLPLFQPAISPRNLILLAYK